MKIKPKGSMVAICPQVPERCSRCGVPLFGMGVDSPSGWLCATDCGMAPLGAALGASIHRLDEGAPAGA